MQLNGVAHQCVDNLSHSHISVSEKGKRVTFDNYQRDIHQIVRVDGCIVTTGPRADWIISKANVASIVIELKGRDVEHAIDQLFATVANNACKPWIIQPTKLLIVCAKYPSFDTKIAKAQLKARKMGMSLKVVCRSVKCRIEDV